MLTAVPTGPHVRETRPNAEQTKMIAKRSRRVSGWHGATLTVIILGLPASTHAARPTGYLNLHGPTPMRFQAKALPGIESAKPSMTEVASTGSNIAPPKVTESHAPETPPTQPTPPATPTNATEADWLKSLLHSPLWSAIGEALDSDLLARSLGTALRTEISKLPSPAGLPSVTPEMLTEFFKVPEASSPAAASPQVELNKLPAAVFVLPSSQAIYRSP